MRFRDTSPSCGSFNGWVATTASTSSNRRAAGGPPIGWRHAPTSRRRRSAESMAAASNLCPEQRQPVQHLPAQRRQAQQFP